MSKRISRPRQDSQKVKGGRQFIWEGRHIIGEGEGEGGGGTGRVRGGGRGEGEGVRGG